MRSRIKREGTSDLPVDVLGQCATGERRLQVENVPVLSRPRVNPVIVAESIGLTPISPVTVEFGTVEIPELARIAKFPAIPRIAGAGPAAVAVPVVKHYVLLTAAEETAPSSAAVASKHVAK